MEHPGPSPSLSHLGVLWLSGMRQGRLGQVRVGPAAWPRPQSLALSPERHRIQFRPAHPLENCHIPGPKGLRKPSRQVHGALRTSYIALHVFPAGFTREQHDWAVWSRKSSYPLRGCKFKAQSVCSNSANTYTCNGLTKILLKILGFSPWQNLLMFTLTLSSVYKEQ